MMSGLSEFNPTGRFTGLAALYAQCRPTYPAAALDFIMDHCQLGPRSLLVDVGCGTGISSRLFAERGVSVIGIEPNAEMRAQAQAAVAEGLSPTYQEGRAEATGLPASRADVVLAAQAFHWFEPEKALAEFHRILRPDGWAVLMWNERDESDPFTAAYGKIIRSAPDAAAVEVPRGTAGKALLSSPLFDNADCRVFRQHQQLDEAALHGRAFSASYAPREPKTASAFAAALSDLFARSHSHGQVTLHYETGVYLARRRRQTS
jgi:SAM-dependent methyltransferase